MATEVSTLQSDLRAAKREARRYLDKQPYGRHAVAFGIRAAESAAPAVNVVGVGIAEKVADHALTGELCVKFYVRRKLPRSRTDPKGDRLPSSIAGVPTDVEQVGRVEAFQENCSAGRMRFLRPAPCGVSVAHFRSTAGTIGAVVRVEPGAPAEDSAYILSNNHVLANFNDASPGESILQPAPLDGGSAGDVLGQLVRFAPIDFDGGENTVDCAIAAVPQGIIQNVVCSIGEVKPAVEPRRNMTVIKHGRTTGLTRGIVTDVDADFSVDYGEKGRVLFVGQIVVRGVPPTTPFGAHGDSGSAVLNEDNAICGLLFGGSSEENYILVNPIGAVFDALRVTLA